MIGRIAFGLSVALTSAILWASPAHAESATSPSEYAFNVVSETGTPAYRDKCKVIRYSVDPSIMNYRTRPLIRRALSVYHRAAGARFKAVAYDQADPYSHGVSLAFNGSDTLAANVLATSGPGVIIDPANVDYLYPSTFRSFVTFNMNRLYSTGWTMLDAATSHELGHVFNLAHVTDRDALMFPIIVPHESNKPRPADLAGLSHTLRNVTC